MQAQLFLGVKEEIRANKLPPKSGYVLEAILDRGERPRGEIAALIGTGDRQARRITSALKELYGADASKQ